MKENKIDFIICYNDELYINECIRYIERLNVPEGMEKEIIGIAGAKSMAAGYNAGMNASDAKYKVYLHQDVFILNQDFIGDVVEIFSKYKEYGMLGVIGSTRMIPNANYWNEWDVGITLGCTGISSIVLKDGDIPNPPGIVPVEAIDGMIMITQYDVPWREEIFDGFDFYDISQSVEFQRAGYKVGVPFQKTIWCNHDCGYSNLKNYDLYRKIFCNEYKKEGYFFSADSGNELLCMNSRKALECFELVKKMIEEGDIEGANKFISQIDKKGIFEKNLGILCVIFEIIRNEKIHCIKNAFYESGMQVAELIDKFEHYKFLLWRVENDFSDYEINEELEMVAAREEIIIDLPIIAEAMCISSISTLGKLYWLLYLKTNNYYHFMKSEEVQPEIDRKEMIGILKGLKNILGNLKRLTENEVYSMAIDNIKEIYSYMLFVDRHGYHLLIEDEKFHISYYEAIYYNRKIEVFFERYQIWLNNMELLIVNDEA